MAGRFILVTEMAERLGVSRETVRQMCEEGRFGARQLREGSPWKASRAKFDEFTKEWESRT
jgi:excisionase family DNA binding protein